MPGREEASVRRELARFPKWSRAETGPSGSHWTDVRPLERAPRIRWTWSAGGAARGEAQLLASPLGVVVSVALDRAERASTATILSPDGAVVRSWERERSAAPLAFEQSLVLDPRSTGVFAIDPVTGDERAVVAAREGLLTAEAACGSGLIVVPDEDDLCVHELTADSCVPTWKIPRPHSAVFRAARHTAATTSRVYLSAPGFARGGVFTAFERATGAELWRSQRLLAADDAGAVALEDDLVAWSAAGERLWQVGRGTLNTVHALQPDAAIGDVATSEGAGSLVVLERASGRARPQAQGQGARELAVARDRVYSVRREWQDAEGRDLAQPREVVAATTLEGEVRWRFPLEWEQGVVLALAPAHARLYVLTSAANVVCFEESPA